MHTLTQNLSYIVGNVYLISITLSFTIATLSSICTCLFFLPPISPALLARWPTISTHLKSDLEMPKIQQAANLNVSHLNVNK